MHRLLLILLFLLATPAFSQLPPEVRRLAGAWESVAPVPLPQGDPQQCDGHGEYVQERARARVVIRPEELWFHPRGQNWWGGIYASVPVEIVCRGASGDVVLQRDVHGQARPAGDVDPIWRGNGSLAVGEGQVTLTAADYTWTVEPGGERIRAVDQEGGVWTFARAALDPDRDAPGFFTLNADFDGDGGGDQMRVVPGRHDRSTMMAYLASGATARVAEIPCGAAVAVAPARTWRNADGTQLVLPAGRAAVLVSVEPAEGRSDVVLHYIENGEWRRWEYAPD